MASPARYFAPVDFRTNFPALSGIRSFCLAIVFCGHYAGGFTGGRLVHLLDWIRPRCWFSLDLFFVLSGFLITGIVYDTQSDSRFFLRFFGRRAIRILPIFYIVPVILLLLTPIVHYQWKWMQLTFLIYLGNFFATSNQSLYIIPSAVHPHATAFVSHFWSLFVEEQFYFFWPAVVWKVRDRIRLIKVAVALSAFSFLLRTIVVYTFHSPVAEHWTNHTLPFRLDTILMGGILALVLRGENADRWQRACRWLFLAATPVAAVLFILPSHFGESLLRSVGVTVVALGCTGLVGSTLRVGSPAFRLFGLRPLRYFGYYSYGFFVYHLLFFGLWIQLRLFLGRTLHSPNLGGVLMLILTFATTFLVAKLSYDLFEIHFLRMKKYFQYDAEIASHKHAYRT